jgi:hypothetical protein
MSKAIITSFPIRWFRTGALLLAMGLTVAAAQAAERVLRIEAPLMVKAGVEARAKLVVTTNAGQGEVVGFLHAEVSVDGGKTWAALCYLDKGTADETRPVVLPAAPAGGTIMVRARVAFRGGAAGDVDFQGGAIRWDDSWEKWAEPPARVHTISVRK